jgi:hypothetical protein
MQNGRITHLNGLLSEGSQVRPRRPPLLDKSEGRPRVWGMGQIGPKGVTGQSVGHGALAPPFSPILIVGCDVPHPSTYIRGPLEESLTQVN